MHIEESKNFMQCNFILLEHMKYIYILNDKNIFFNLTLVMDRMTDITQLIKCFDWMLKLFFFILCLQRINHH